MQWSFKGNQASLSFYPELRRYELVIIYEKRIIPESPWDVIVRWDARLTPTKEDAADKAEQILTQEWPNFSKYL